MTDTPELDKMATVRDESQPIGAFLEWLSEQGIILCKWETPRESQRCTGVQRDIFDRDNCQGTGVALRTVKTMADLSLPRGEERDASRVTLIEAGGECTKCNGTGSYEYDGAEQYLPDFMPIEKRLAQYFNIDLAKVEQERRAVLEAIRSA